MINRYSFNQQKTLAIAVATGLTAFLSATAPALAATFNVTSVEFRTLIDGSDSTVSGITYLNQSLPITQLTAGSESWLVGGPPNPVVTFRRSGGGSAPGRQIIWGERSNPNPQTTVLIPRTTTTQAAIAQNNILIGTDNLFVNSNQTDGNQSDVERVDFLISSGVRVTSDRAVVVFERGTSTSHDGFKIAAITAVDRLGNPTAFSTLNTILRGWGTTELRAGTPTYTVLNNSSGSLRNTANVTGQNIGGILITLEQLATPGTRIFGYSLFGLDVTDLGSSSNLVNWTNSSFFPRNTRETVTQGANGIDLLAANVGVV